MASCILFVIGVLLASYLARHVALLIVGRFIIGSAIGVTSSVTPMYIAEMAPARYRGGLVMCYQLAITAGILVALGIGHALTPSRNWRVASRVAPSPPAAPAPIITPAGGTPAAAPPGA